MAPDLNSVPPSPRNLMNNNNATTPRGPSRQNSTSGAAHQPGPSNSTNASRRASQIFPMSPPPLPLASPGGTIPSAQQTVSHQHQPFPPLSPLITSTGSSFSGTSSGGEGTNVPMRHPRPLTAAELHLELEKEQEAVVNRLTRELTALRAHSASVASTTSSTSTAPNPAEQQAQYPTSSRRHRSSSSVSRGSFNHGIPLTPATAGIPHFHRPSLSGTREGHAEPGIALSRTVSSASGTGVSTARYEETAQARMELEEAKRENEILRQRVRELEGLIRGRRESAVERNEAGDAIGTARSGNAPT